jgi:TPR repeat protein
VSIQWRSSKTTQSGFRWLSLRTSSYLGQMYEMGQGVPEDRVQAYAWYAAGAGQSDSARASMKRLGGKLTATEVAEALRRAQDWQARHPPR